MKKQYIVWSILLIVSIMSSTLLSACTSRQVVPLSELTGPDGNPWWSNRVFYEIFVRSFADGNNDGKGDFVGLTQKLDYLNDGNPKTTTDLGIGGIWLMPINPSPSYHGYDVLDYKAVNPDYGTMDEFKKFLEEAHKREIRVIIDLVLNHTALDHPWFKASMDPNSEYRDYYIWSAEDPGGVGPWGQKIWHKASNGEYYYGVFWDGMPDLNYRSPKVREEMLSIVNFWLKDVGVDGFRLDGAMYVLESGKDLKNTQDTHDWYKEMRKVYKEASPNAMTVGEVWETNFSAVKYVKTGDELDMVFDFDQATGLMGGVASGDGKKIANSMQFNGNMYPKNTRAIFLTNHDQNRIFNQLSGNVEKAKNAATLLLTAPGVPFLYYGEEIGMAGSKPDEKIRTPMQWSAEKYAGFTTATPWESVNGDYEKKNVEIQTKDDTSLLSHYRALIQARNQSLPLCIGDMSMVDTGNSSLVAYLRYTETEAVLVIVNLSAEAVSDYSLALNKGPLSGTYSLKALVGEGSFNALTANAAGGFDAFKPADSLPVGANLVLELKK